MPELKIEDSPFIDYLRENPFYWERDQVKLIASEYGVPLLGSGRECVVFDNTEGRVSAARFLPTGADQMKTQFYLHRIFSTLFPHNFPHIYAAFGYCPNDPRPYLFTGTIRQKIVGNIYDYEYCSLSTLTKAFNRVHGILHRSLFIKYPFKKVVDISAEMNLPLSFDSFSGNFIYGEDGGEYYVDSLEPVFDIVKLENAERFALSGDYSQRDQDIVTNSVNRIVAIHRWLDKVRHNCGNSGDCHNSSN